MIVSVAHFVGLCPADGIGGWIQLRQCREIRIEIIRVLHEFLYIVSCAIDFNHWIVRSSSRHRRGGIVLKIVAALPAAFDIVQPYGWRSPVKDVVFYNDVVVRNIGSSIQQGCIDKRVVFYGGIDVTGIKGQIQAVAVFDKIAFQNKIFSSEVEWVKRYVVQMTSSENQIPTYTAKTNKPQTSKNLCAIKWGAF
ncbi:hypothetical protein DESC_390003 [Desulfosarcina cetonica]|nr:hypothetical protein DESC_390003 [Desulfosarcina cetonica]